MKTMNWCDLLIKREDIAKMDAETLDAVTRATDDRLLALALGVSGLGNLLACAASNEESGLCPKSVANVGWMLETIGSLISDVTGVSNQAADATITLKSKDKTKVS